MTRRDPEVLDLDTHEDGLRASLLVPEDLVYFDGHFDFQSILPAVVQVGWVLDLAEEHLSIDASTDEIETLKFREKLRPGDECELSIDWETDADRLSFAFSRGDERISSGRVTVTA